MIYTVEKKKKLGMDTVEHTASTILVVQIVTLNLKETTFYSILELWLFTNHMDICGCFFPLFFLFCFCSHIKRVGFASALLPYGHRVVFGLFFFVVVVEDELPASQRGHSCGS